MARWRHGSPNERSEGFGMARTAWATPDIAEPASTAASPATPVPSSMHAKIRKGPIQLRDVRGWFKVDHQLYVGSRCQTKLVDDMGWQVDSVRNALGAFNVPVRPALCFVDGDWGWFPNAFELRGALVCWPKKLVEKISAEGSLGPEDALSVAGYLSNSLPARPSQRSASQRN